MEWKHLKVDGVDGLKNELRKRQLQVGGNKFTLIQRLEEYEAKKSAEIAAPTLAQHQDTPTLSWEEDFENVDFDDADFDDMLAEMDMEVITGRSTMNECQQQQSGCHQQQQPPIIDRSAECLSISSGSAMVRQPPIT